MDTLTELKYYCETVNPVGALMLTGEWGCGKTYLIKNNLKDDLISTHAIVVVSLFGLSSIAEVKATVKQKWLSVWADDKGAVGTVAKGFIKFKNAVAEVTKNVVPSDTAKGIAESVIAVNPTDFMNVENKIGEKRVVLVFDDFERCRLDPVELLGVINDYCENQKFHTIIVANEEKIEEDMQVDLSYKNIKEKIIQRTIPYSLDYNRIISSIIDSDFLEDGDYKQFITSHIEELQNLFNDGIPVNNLGKENLNDKLVERISQGENPHNLRSFKCAIQDFKRVYDILSARGFSDPDEWLYAFVIYSICTKAGLIQEDSIETFSEVSIDQAYPCAYNQEYLCDFEKDWIKNGEWNEKVADRELSAWVKASSGLTPEDELKKIRIDFMDEDRIEKGFPKVLSEAYAGDLSLDEYVMFVINSRVARHYNYQFPKSIDWNRVERGLDSCIRKMINNGIDDSHYRNNISDLTEFTEEEVKIYNTIRNCRENYGLVSAQNRKKYLEIINRDSLTALVYFRDKILNSFDEEMAEATFESFKRRENAEKSQFVGSFRDLWSGLPQRKYVDFEITLAGFKKLRDLLEEEKARLSENKTIAKSYFDRFIHVLNDWIAEIEGMHKTVKSEEESN